MCIRDSINAEYMGILNELGEISSLHFIDMQQGTANISRPYTNCIKRCEDCLQKLQYLISVMNKFNKTIIKCTDAEQFLSNLKVIMNQREKAEHTYFQEIEQLINQKTVLIDDQMKYYLELNLEKNLLIEYRAVLKKSQLMLGINLYRKQQPQDIRGSLLEGFTEQEIALHYLTGVISSEEAQRFSRMIFRVSKGNIMTLIEDFEPTDILDELVDPKIGIKMKKSVFVLIFIGGQYQILFKKVIRLCDFIWC
eukprot:TRINITY_DN12852_c0_g1_i1.p1 TRINITY_DN12852_c0_g1~~TRINITY_DN12852_c0_g1_i1.p1  ORF type:complete len:252 (+),score=30.75 TRINITY_DN12852_c0_g1_i1:149-904(+)